MSGVWLRYLRILEKYPGKTQAVQTGLLLCAGDLSAQFLVERRSIKTYEFRRTASFGTLGLLFLGPTLRMWYLFLDRYIGKAGGIVVLKKVALDQLIFGPSCLVAIFAIVGVLQGQTLDEVKITLQQNYYSTVMAAWTLWPAAQLINFYYVPPQHRILFVNVVALFWNTYLCYKTSKPLDI